MSNVMTQPVIETHPGALDMSGFEAQFNEAEALAAAGNLATQGEVIMEGAEDIQLAHGFDPNLLNMFLHATPGSELANNLANLMVADMVVNNAIEYGLLEQEQQDNLYRYNTSVEDDESDD